MKKLISIRALMTRVNRKLAKESKQLKRHVASSGSGTPLTEYAVIDLKTNTIVNYHMASEMQEFARSLGCLACLEEVANEP